MERWRSANPGPNAQGSDSGGNGDTGEAVRKRYETKQDLDNEEEVALFLSKKWKADFIKLEEKKWIVDFLIKKGDHYGWAELKCANINFGQYPFMISYKKIEAARRLTETSGKKFTLLFKCNDELCYHKWDFTKDYKFEYGGRTVQTRDKQDIEPVFRIDPKDCTIVKGFYA